MWQRILAALGLVPAVAAGLASQKDPDQDHGLETDGHAAVSFVAGHKTAIPQDAAETQDERLARITDRALVWPGKPETIFCANQETMACRYDLTVTDLPDTLYLRRPPVGGMWQPEGGVLLQPGEEASFEVVFVPPPASDKTRTRPFSYVLTRFDPRRSSDPGEIVTDEPMRWVALPEPGDLKISADPLRLITRPWRRTALLQFQLRNKALLPSSVSLLITRAATKEALLKEPEDVDKIAQSVPELTPGTWRCLLPPFPERSSYYATVTGTARVADREDYALSLPKPVLVQYVPWLRMARDWFFLVGVLLVLMWAVWGFPVYETPKILVDIQFAGLDKDEIPSGGAAGDVQMTAQLYDAHHFPVGDPIKGFSRPNGVTEIDLPGRWCGFRWFGKSGWNGFCSVPQDYSLAVTALAGKEPEFSRYSLSGAYPGPGTTIQVTDLTNPFGNWATPQTLNIPRKKGVIVRVFVKDLGWLAARKDQQYGSITYTLDGTPYPLANLPLPRDAATPVTTIDLSDKVADGNPHILVVTASCLGSDTSNVQKTVVPMIEPYDIGLAFPAAAPIDKGKVVAQAVKDSAAAGTAAAGATAAASAAATAAGANPPPAVKAQMDAIGKAAQDAGQAAQTAQAASAAASAAATPEDAQAQAAIAAQAQGAAAKALAAAQDALTKVQQLTKQAVVTPPVKPVVIHPPVKPVHLPARASKTAEDYLLLDQWDRARATALASKDIAYQHAINAISYAMRVAPKDAPTANLAQANAECTDALQANPSDDDKALIVVAQGWIARAQDKYPLARVDFAQAKISQPNLLLAEVAAAEGQADPENRINALLALLRDPSLHLTPEDKAAIKKQVADENAVLHS